MHPWLTDASGRLSVATGADAGSFELDDATVALLLDLARVAAHDSGDRTNAPLLCYLVGLAQGRGGGSLETLIDAASADGRAR